MKIYSIETESYNDRRYGKPWIATIDFSGNSQGDYVFGDFIGTAGEPGTLEVDANIGDIVATGQKDMRKSKPATIDYYTVTASGLEFVSQNKNDAYRMATNSKSTTPETKGLEAEKEALLKRLAEIDGLLAEQ
jgi:hypothetical protein